LKNLKTEGDQEEILVIPEEDLNDTVYYVNEQQELN